MDRETIRVLFALLRSAIGGPDLTEEERALCTPEALKEALKQSKRHDVIHLTAYGMKKNDLIPEGNTEIEKNILKAVYRYERTKYEYEAMCRALEEARIPFIPLKGSILRDYYPEPWMRTSCDIDVLVRRCDLKRARDCLIERCQYTGAERTPHDISMYSPMGIHIELHFDLVEDERANHANRVLRSVWNYVSVREGSEYFYEMTDAFFYFYHIAHMAKHFENGGCGIRPFLDLWILDRMGKRDAGKRDDLLRSYNLFRFAEVSRTLSQVWLEGREADELSVQVESCLLMGGVYGSNENQAAIQRRNLSGRIGYVLSRIFVPTVWLKKYYPILEKHRWLMPLMQVRRWFRLLNVKVFKTSKAEKIESMRINHARAEEMDVLLDRIGL